MNLKEKIRARIETLLATGNDHDHGGEIQFLETLLKVEEKPEHVGTWIFLVQDNELIKFGKDGDTKHPMPPNSPEILKEAEHHHRPVGDQVVYIANVFNNGQIKTIEFGERT